MIILSDKEKIYVTFLVGKKRITLPCLAFVSEKTIMKGLMGVRRMHRGVGAFFVFDECNYHKAWMKNTLIPLDILFVNKDGIIVEIVRGKPESLESLGGHITSKYMIETVAGFVDANGIMNGQKIRVDKVR